MAGQHQGIGAAHADGKNVFVAVVLYIQAVVFPVVREGRFNLGVDDTVVDDNEQGVFIAGDSPEALEFVGEQVGSNDAVGCGDGALCRQANSCIRPANVMTAHIGAG